MTHAPNWRGSRRVLLTGGVILHDGTPVDQAVTHPDTPPVPTAMFINGHEIAWIGSAADAQRYLDDADEH